MTDMSIRETLYFIGWQCSIKKGTEQEDVLWNASAIFSNTWLNGQITYSLTPKNLLLADGTSLKIIQFFRMAKKTHYCSPLIMPPRCDAEQLSSAKPEPL